ncbi:MAG: F420-0:Gamma-glutamyl ligase [Microcoleaceae cyanobacterium]
MIVTSLGIGVGLILLFLGLVASLLEIQYRRRPGNDLILTPGDWHQDLDNPQHYILTGEMELRNRTDRLEVMVPEVSAEVKLLSGESLEGISWTTQIISGHTDAPPRPDRYWFAYIIKSRDKTKLKVQVEIKGKNLTPLKSAWVKVHYLTYGPQGRIPKTTHAIMALKFPDAHVAPTPRKTDVSMVFPIPTHLLTHLDDPVEVIKRYVKPHAQPGDIVTLGETPLALMQQRFRHPSEIHPGWVAKRVCYFFLPTSSLATACGLQALVDVVGPSRVFFAFIGGAIAKIFRQGGVFYQLAGEQARLIDDVTGTLPPYEQFIVLGPDQPQQVVERIQQETGLAAAIVDVNDLKAVKILAATSDVSQTLLEQSLRSNPAGNADEQTPVVLIRPT